MPTQPSRACRSADASPHAGLLLCGLEALLTHDPGSLINIIFYFFTGRFVGVGITGRVQQPVRSAVGY